MTWCGFVILFAIEKKKKELYRIVWIEAKIEQGIHVQNKQTSQTMREIFDKRTNFFFSLYFGITELEMTASDVESQMSDINNRSNYIQV